MYRGERGPSRSRQCHAEDQAMRKMLALALAVLGAGMLGARAKSGVTAE
jgi:hypothetical protein